LLRQLELGLLTATKQGGQKMTLTIRQMKGACYAHGVALLLRGNSDLRIPPWRNQDGRHDVTQGVMVSVKALVWFAL
jgi:hypothetical protein